MTHSHVALADAATTSRALLGQLFVLMRHASMFGADHPATLATAGAVQTAIQNVGPPFTLEFIGGASFRDRTLIPLEFELFEHVRELAGAFHNLGADEVAVDAVPSVEDLLVLGGALARGAQASWTELQARTLRGLRFRDLPFARYGEEAEQVDAAVFAAAQLALAIRDTERLQESVDAGAWPWALGVGIVRRYHLPGPGP